jgi:hypothetical protein
MPSKPLFPEQSAVNPDTSSLGTMHMQYVTAMRCTRLQSRQSKGRGQRAQRCLVIKAARDVDFADRAVASLPYLVPLFDGLKYGKIVVITNVVSLQHHALCKLPTLTAVLTVVMSHMSLH